MVASDSARFFLLAVLFKLCSARTDLSGCVSSTAISPAGASLIWYVPGTGETCEFLDCGGGRAPPKTTVPGCAAYSGTATYSPSYLPGYGPTSSVSSTTAASGTLESAVSSMVVTSMLSSSTTTLQTSITVSSSAADVSSTLTTTSDPYSFSSSSTSVVHSTASAISSTPKSSSESSAAASASNLVSAGTLLEVSKFSLGVVGLIAATLG